jgi:type VI secretion system secreted protein Hcp
MQLCAEGEHIKKAVLTCRKAGKEQQEFLVVTMSDLLVSSYHTSGNGHGDSLPQDQVALNFTRIEFDYKAQKADGTLGGTCHGGYDLKIQKAV